MEMTRHGVAIIGSGSATPTQALDNEGLSQVVETSDEWISSRTGIRQRKLAASNESLTSLAAIAAQQAIEMAGVAPTDIDLVVLATSTADDLFGSASKLQASIGASNAFAFDLTAACSGFIFGIVTASQFIRTGAYKNILLVGADILSRWVDWSDRRTCVLFGDGAGAVVMQAQERDRLRGFDLHSDGTQNGCLTLAFQSESQALVDGMTVEKGTFEPIQMQGQDIYKFAVRQVPAVIKNALAQSRLTVEDVDWLLLHQANQRILDATASRLKIPPEKVISNMAKYGNTSAASIPIALDEYVREGKIKPGDIIASAGFGAGLTWGAAIFEWG